MIGIKVGVGQVFVVKLYDIARERLPISESSLTEIFVRATKVFIFFSGVIRQNRLKHRKYRIRRLLADIRFFGKRLHIAYIFISAIANAFLETRIYCFRERRPRPALKYRMPFVSNTRPARQNVLFGYPYCALYRSATLQRRKYAFPTSNIRSGADLRSDRCAHENFETDCRIVYLQ